MTEPGMENPEPDISDQQVGSELLSVPAIPMVRAALIATYGADFPLAADEPPTRSDWATWTAFLWERHSSAMQARLDLSERNRLFRKGVQWVSSTGNGPWREPIKPDSAVRAVENVIAPALDMRVQIISEQRPGFRTKPASSDVADLKRAEAQQSALEYQYDNQDMGAVIREAAYWAGTDGVSFLEVYWDPNAGPWHELPTNPDDPESPTHKQPIGDLRTRVRTIEQVRVSPEATATQRPHYMVIREQLPASQAAGLYGAEVLESSTSSTDAAMDAGAGAFQNGFELPSKDQLYRDQRTVERTTVYVEPCEYLPHGLTVVALGKSAPYVGPLVCGAMPVIRFTDGSTDPAYYPAPIMDGWIQPQMRINKIKSLWITSVRFNSGGKLISREGAIVHESMTPGGGTSTVIVRDPRPFDDLVKQFPMVQVGSDAKELLASEVRQFENLSGWNDVSRGQFAGPDQSGKAIMAIREQLERIFTPTVHAASRAMTDWSKVSLLFMKWGYTMPRQLAVQGQSRPDLAREISSDDFDGVTDVFIDPETLMPMPRSLRLFLLDQLHEKQVISPQEYRRRLPFAWVKNMSTPDDDHEARARRVAEAIRQTGDPMALPILWQDNEAIHQDVLERELLLPDDNTPEIRAAANTRWMALAQQAQTKQQGMAPPPQAPPGGGSQGPTLGPQEQPMPGANSGIALNPEQGQQQMLQGNTDPTQQRQLDQFGARF